MTSYTSERFGSYYRMLSVLFDLALLNFSGYLGFLLVNHFDFDFPVEHLHVGQVLLVNFLWFNVTQITRLYQNIFAKDAIPTIQQALSSLLLFAGVLLLLVFYVPEISVSARLIFFTCSFFAPLFFVGKIAFLLIRRSHRARLIEYTRVVIVGAGPVGRELAVIMQCKSSMGYRIVGFFDDRVEDDVDGLPLLGNVSDCVRYVKQHKIKEIYCTLPDRAINKINLLMREADKVMVRFKLVPDVMDYFRKDVNVSMLGHFPVITARTEPLENFGNKVMKRMFDLVFSSMVILFLLSWLIPIIALIIKIDSKGPIFFKQLRSGKDNKPFYCLKFRSMKINGLANKAQATKNDIRITRVGAFLRKTSLDELPQFFNVLVGNMSVVGPRPHMLKHTKEYSSLIDAFMVRHFVLPGITGWAQVRGHRGETQIEGAMEARVEADIWYLEHWSLFLDLKIVFLTVWQVFAGDENAY